MVRKRRQWRKRFECNHRGFGQYCHRCLPKKSRLTSSPNPSKPHRRPKTAEQRAAQWQWQQQFATDPINLTHLPKPIVIQTRQILTALNQGVNPGQLKGRRFNFDRTLLRIPVTYRYRLLCRWQGGKIIPLQVLSHEAYNAIACNKKRLSS